MQTTGKIFELPYAKIEGGKLLFDTSDGAELALSIGAFFVAIPEHLDVTPGLELARNFYRPTDATRPRDRYSGHRSEQHADSKLGYSDRPDQVEQLQLESEHWDAYLPGEVTALLREMEEITLDTLYGVFAAAGVPERDWETITGGAREGTGWCHSTISTTARSSAAAPASSPIPTAASSPSCTRTSPGWRYAPTTAGGTRSR